MASAPTPNTKFFTYKEQVPLAKGEALHFLEGRGYYAAVPGAAPAAPAVKSLAPTDPRTGLPKTPYSPPTRPTPPPAAYPAGLGAATAAQIDAQAGVLAQAGLTPQQDEIRRQQALAAQQAAADEAAITGFQGAAAGILKDIAPTVGDAYQRAADAEAQYGQGLATGVRDDVAARVAADSAFMRSQGQSGGPGPDANALHDTVYGLNGQIPADSFAEQGAAATAWGAAQPAIALNAGREELDARMAQARTDNDQYAQQLIQLAQQYPGLKAQALQQLNQYEIDKANYRLNAQHTKASDALALRSEKAQEKAAGLTASNAKATLQYKWASLQFQTQKELDRAKAAASKGKTIDVPVSKLLGHIVYKDGSQDASIKVQQSGSSAAASAEKAKSTARVTAFNYATKLLGDPVKAPKGSTGQYLAAKGVKPSAVYKPLYPGGPTTTNNPKYAARTGGAGGYADAVQKVWAEIDGDGLMARFNITHEQVMQIVNDALRRAGWKRK